MKTEIVSICENSIDTEVLKRAGDILKHGGLVAFPTETVYGLGGDALQGTSAKKIYEAKGRPSDNPLIVHIADMEALDLIAKDVPDEAYRLAEKYWPGPLTMIFKKTEAVPLETTGGLETVAVRMPVHPIAKELIRYAGGYIAAPSANKSGRPSPTKAKYVIEDLDGRVDMIIDGGESEIGLESTIVDFSEQKPVVLRPGFITEEDLGIVLGEVLRDQTIIDGNSRIAPKAPGMKYRHYAPSGDLFIVEGANTAVTSYINEKAAEGKNKGLKTGVLCTDETMESYRADVVKSLGRRSCEEEIAHTLFGLLREMDDEKVSLIYAESFEKTGIGLATMNRLLKAAGHQIIKLDN